MSNELKIFNNPEFGEIRTITNGEQVLFCASDVATALGYAKPNNAVSQHCRATLKRGIPISGKIQDVNFIPEGDVYRLIIRSKLPAAEKFERWVFDEVLPTIRKHGAYMTDEALHRAITEPDFLIQLATELKKEKEARREAERKIEEDRPKVIFADAVEVSESDCTVGALAKIPNQNGVDVGQNRLFQWLRDNGYLHKSGKDRNRPLQRYVEQGLFRIKEGYYVSDGLAFTYLTTYITGKGQRYFVNLFLNSNSDTEGMTS